MADDFEVVPERAQAALADVNTALGAADSVIDTCVQGSQEFDAAVSNGEPELVAIMEPLKTAGQNVVTSIGNQMNSVRDQMTTATSAVSSILLEVEGVDESYKNKFSGMMGELITNKTIANPYVDDKGNPQPDRTGDVWKDAAAVKPPATDSSSDA